MGSVSPAGVASLTTATILEEFSFTVSCAFFSPSDLVRNMARRTGCKETLGEGSLSMRRAGVSENIIVEMRNITKKFGGVTALNRVCLTLRKGEILGLVGDNGAGKSTLMKILSGALKQDEGEIFYENEKVEINNPLDAKAMGIEMVYQDLALCGNLNFPQNLFLGREALVRNKIGQIFGYLAIKFMISEAEKTVRKFAVNIPDVTSRVEVYSGGQRQAVALCKAVYWGSKVLILDEPTSALGPKESQKALELMRSLRDEHGISAIIVSHNLRHIFSVVDRIFVLRRGEKVAVVNVCETTADQIVAMIVGANTVASN